MCNRSWILGTLSAVLVFSAMGCGGNVDLDATDEINFAEKSQALSIGIDFEHFRIVLEDEFLGANDDIVRFKQYEYIGCEAAYVIFLNGRTEFMEKYDPLFTAINELPWETTADQTLADLPITFFAIDHAGQGLSGGLRSHIDDYDTFTANVMGLIKHIRKLDHHHKPIYLMSHSMGGLISARFAQQHPEYVDGLILSSPMFGINPPPGVTLEELQQLAVAYSAPQPYGFGLADRCARAVDPSILGLIGYCMTEESGNCPACFMGDDSAEVCANFPFDWNAMRDAWALLHSDDAIGCEVFSVRDPALRCDLFERDEEGNVLIGEDGLPVFHATFNGTTSDVPYCTWMETNPLAGPDMTFGWIYESFEAIGKLFLPENLDTIRHIPTLLLSTPIDPIVIPASHEAFCNEMDHCQKIDYITNWATGPYYFHELLAETDRATVIADVRAFLEDLIYQ